MKKALHFLTFLFISCFTGYVAHAQQASFSVNTGFICAGNDIRFINQSSNADSIFWKMGNGDTSHADKFWYNYSMQSSKSVDTFTATIFAYNGPNTDSFSRDIVVQAQAKAAFRDSIIATWVQFFHECENYLGLSWDFGNGKTSISDAVPLSHFYTDEGEYDVVLIANTEYGCNDTFRKSIVLVDSTDNSIGEKNPYQMSVYPNPFHKNAQLQFTLENTQNLTLSVSSADGRVLFYQDRQYGAGQNDINLAAIMEDAHPGLYFISLSHEQSTYILKVHKE